MGWSEDSLHRWLAEQPWPKRLAGSRGHDAAVLELLGGRPVVCTDQCIDGVHFRAVEGAGAAGRKAVLRALSDLAATAACPVSVLVAVRAPDEIDESDLRAALEGAQSAAAESKCEVVAGDLARAPGPWSLAVTALGVFELSGTPPGRERATAGQMLAISGPIGGSLALGRHLNPVPRFDAARVAVDRGATALMDVSDGLAWDAFRLARTAGVRIEIDASDVPIHDDAREAARASGREAIDHALHDGEDHELIATLAGGSPPGGWRTIGRVVRGEGLAIVDSDGVEAEWTPALGGWQHRSSSFEPRDDDGG